MRRKKATEVRRERIKSWNMRRMSWSKPCLTVSLTVQRDPKGIAKKNGAQLSHRDDIFSQLPPILRSDW